MDRWPLDLRHERARGPPEGEERPSIVINLMDALKQSLKGRTAAKKTARASARSADCSPPGRAKRGPVGVIRRFNLRKR
jgi:hypothetical protein